MIHLISCRWHIELTRCLHNRLCPEESLLKIDTSLQEPKGNAWEFSAWGLVIKIILFCSRNRNKYDFFIWWNNFKKLRKKNCGNTLTWGKCKRSFKDVFAILPCHIRFVLRVTMTEKSNQLNGFEKDQEYKWNGTLKTIIHTKQTLQAYTNSCLYRQTHQLQLWYFPLRKYLQQHVRC